VEARHTVLRVYEEGVLLSERELQIKDINLKVK
jgi:hypothetical protein